MSTVLFVITIDKVCSVNSGSRDCGPTEMASKGDYKAPPTLSKDITYSNWKRELSIWQAFTSLEKKKQPPAIF